MALPFDVKKYTQEKNKNNAIRCRQQAIANQLVSNSMPMNNAQGQLQQIPAKQ